MPNATEGDTSNGTEGAEKPLTLADLKAVLEAERTANTAAMNSAISSHTKRLNKQWEEKLAKSKEPAKTGEDDDEETEPAGAKVTKTETAKTTPQEPPKADPALLEMRKQIDALTKANAKAEEARKAAERRSLEEKVYGNVRTALTGKVAAGAEAHALTMLKANGRIAIADDGNTRIRGIAKDEPEDGYDIEEGVAAYLKSDEAKFFVPPPNAGPANAKRSQAFGNAPNGANGSAPHDAVNAFEAKHGPIAKSLI